MKKISVIVPCYNQAKYLAETLQSILNQTYPHWECIIVNDGSPDNSVEIANQFIEKDNRFKLIDQPNKGVSAARNAGIELAQGDYIQFLDSDDLIHPQKFEIQLKNIAEDAGIALAFYMNFEDDIHNAYVNTWNSHKILDLREDILYHWGNNFTIPIHSALFSSLYFKEHGIRFPELFTGEEDWVFWVKCTGVNSVYTLENTVLAYYRQHSESACRKSEMMIESRVNASFFIYKDLLKNREKEKFEERMKSDYVRQVLDLDSRIKHYRKGKKKYRTLFNILLLVILFLSMVLLWLLAANSNLIQIWK